METAYIVCLCFCYGFNSEIHNTATCFIQLSQNITFIGHNSKLTISDTVMFS